MGVFAGHPLDTLRVRMQQPGSARIGGMGAVFAAVVSEGALFRGLSSPLTTAALTNALCFSAYGAMGRALHPAAMEGTPHSWSTIFLAGSAAGMLTTAVVTPVDLLKVQLQVAQGKAKSPLALVASILRREGPRGLYRGWAVTALRDVPSTGVYYLAYDCAYRGALSSGAESRPLGGAAVDWVTLAAGGAAGVASWGSIYPLDVAKSRLQAAPGRYSGVVDCLRRSVAEEGPSVLLRGLTACLLRAFVVNAAIFAGYEAAMGSLTKMSSHEHNPRGHAGGG